MIVVLRAQDEAALTSLQATAKRAGIPNKKVIDHGLTEVSSGTWTSLAVGPDEVARVDTVTGRLELFRETKEECMLRSKTVELEKQVQQLAGAAGASPPMSSKPGEVWT